MNVHAAEFKLTAPEAGPIQPMPPADGLYALGEQLAHIRRLIRAARYSEAEDYITQVLDRHCACWMSKQATY